MPTSTDVSYILVKKGTYVVRKFQNSDKNGAVNFALGIGMQEFVPLRAFQEQRNELYATKLSQVTKNLDTIKDCVVRCDDSGRYSLHFSSEDGAFNQATLSGAFDSRDEAFKIFERFCERHSIEFMSKRNGYLEMYEVDEDYCNEQDADETSQEPAFL